MPLVEWFSETRLNPPGNPPNFTLACRANVSRVLLLIVPNQNITTLVGAISPPAQLQDAAILCTTSGQQRFELKLATHGMLVQQEWWVAPSAAGFGTIATVYELFRYDSGERQTDGGILLPQSLDVPDSMGDVRQSHVELLGKLVRRGMVTVQHALQADGAGLTKQAVQR